MRGHLATITNTPATLIGRTGEPIGSEPDYRRRALVAPNSAERRTPSWTRMAGGMWRAMMWGR